MADENDEALKAAQGVADKVLRRAAIYNNHEQLTADESAKYIPIFVAPYAVTVEKISFVLASTVDADPANYATLVLYKGEDTVLIAVSSENGWPGFMVTASAVSGGGLVEGEALYLRIDKQGEGVRLPAFHFAVTYVQK